MQVERSILLLEPKYWEHSEEIKTVTLTLEKRVKAVEEAIKKWGVQTESASGPNADFQVESSVLGANLET
jgi:hypothetical protein